MNTGNPAATELPPAVVRVDYEQRDGYHMFTSRDVDGLFIATKSLERAAAAVIPSLQELLRRNFNLDCKVEPAAEFGTFIAHHRNSLARSTQEPTKTYLIRTA